MSKKEQKFQASSHIPFLTQVTAEFSEESFYLNAFSGNQVYRFALSPKHAKRIKMLLEKKIEKYEKEHGELETKLPKEEGSKEDEDLGF